MKIVKESLNNLNRVIDNKDIKANTELSVTETQAYLDGKDIDKHLDDVDKKLDKMVKDSNVEVKTERPKRIRGNKMYVGKLTLDENLFEGFDMHDRFNNGIAPYSKVMYGKILQETDKMYKFDLHSDVGDNHWIGWCYKKSCYVNHY